LPAKEGDRLKVAIDPPQFVRIYTIIPLSYLPVFVRVLFRGMPGVFRNRHHLIFCWLVLMQAVSPGPKTLAGICGFTSAYVTEWRLRRLLKASYWSIELLITWFAHEAMAAFPAPSDAVLYLIGDGSHKNKRGKRNPVVQKGRKSKFDPWFFGIKFVVLMAAWDVYRFPVGIRIILPKDHPDYRKENVLFQEMVREFEPPEWAQRVIVCGDAGFGSRENMKMVQAKDKADPKRRWGFVFAIARTWKTEEGKKIKDLVDHLPRKHYKKTWIPKLPEERGRKTFWIYGKKTRLDGVGDVTVVLSKKGRNLGPKRTKILVTNLPELTPRQILSVYQRRWSVELLFWELKSGLGLGAHQVTKEKDRIEKSVGIAIISYLFLLRARRKDIHSGKSWSIFQLQNNFRIELLTNQIEHNMELKLKKRSEAA
jgi:hypothetical protein